MTMKKKDTTENYHTAGDLIDTRGYRNPALPASSIGVLPEPFWDSGSAPLVSNIKAQDMEPYAYAIWRAVFDSKSLAFTSAPR